ncbi:MAG TPA: NAD(P)H-dependent oxidoreductase [Candidatus Saccharimonadales bacterium]|nr:NAD(P)H-dependent oxidoreductase [Candidatus Saccharimonadales bacterium]
MVTIKVIVGSTRPNRFGIQPAEWLTSYAKKTYSDKVKFELVDLADINLPFLDEPQVPTVSIEKEHSLQWSKIIAEADGFVFVAPEYNHSYSPVLKNAIDFLSSEWAHKPVAFLSYGAAAGGARSVEHLRDVVAWLKMYDLAEQILLPNYFADLDENGNYKFTERHEKNAHEMLEALIFWARIFKEARAKLITKQI